VIWAQIDGFGICPLQTDIHMCADQ